ncbi:type III PLP-dependent enzyme [Treponema putidum]|uniref:ornithine decarboxylase n=1 Tax=Treponema putidum TaxID=221027 RepID=A0AAE9SKV0_9SPIR|nr:type III PLP-dependent enzyme [Treponema putidum]AIN94163.1 ornithine decarboxylase [Treponema putidum]TWI79626.1 ornithine decarboxylase [Treponema putidum]UTY28112.1 type III PLP-dependent enzyme [Treponema putidum]UTY33019.1 type III PLP-dependent enzyme [Treponema putidum]
MDRKDYISDSEWKHFMSFSENLETPCVVINLKTIKKNYQKLRENFPYADIFYAIKANPHEEIITMLNEMGSCFDIASRYELDKVLKLGVSPDRLSYGNTIKKAKDIAYFYEKGVRMFATDSKDDLKNIAQLAPGSRVYVRILVENTTSADWPLSRKFGCHPDMAYDLCIQARDSGLIPYGISFHVGSQQRDIGQWNDAIAKTKYLMDSLEEEEDIKLEMVNMGGGFPASYVTPANDLSEYASEITRYLEDDFGEDRPRIILEPGRSLVGDSGVLVTEVVMISRKNNTALFRWVYLDTGLFNGLIETLNESLKYPIITDKDEGCKKWGEVVLAGPTCDSMDIMYEDYKYSLPINLKPGDRVYFLTTGAYTSSYASVEFNGFPPIKTYIMN